MPTLAPTAATRSARPYAPGTLEFGIALFALLHIGLALLMAIGPHAFFKAVGPFGAYNAHYIRDVATFYAASGVGLAISLAHASWRAPVIALALIQYALHSVNHLADIANAHPAWVGYFDFFSLAAATLLLAWMLRATLRAPMTTRRQGALP
jgi:hypothetical protein